MRSKLQTTGFAYAFAVTTIIVETIVALLIVLVAAGLIEENVLPTVLNISMVTLVVAFFMVAVVLFALSRFVVYIVRLTISLLLVWIAIGFILYQAYFTAGLQVLAVVSVLLFIVISIVFYLSSWMQKRMFDAINEHRVAIERLEDMLGRISNRISREDASQFTRFIGAAKRSWSMLIRSTFAEGTDVGRVLYKSLLIAMVFFLTSLVFQSANIENIIAVYGWPLILAVVIFTFFIVFVDVMRLERLRRQILRST